MNLNHLSRRDFLKVSILAMGSLAFTPWNYWNQVASDWPDGEKFGRVCLGKVSIRSKPDPDASVTKEIYDDAIVVWLREVVGKSPGYGSSRWVETPDGYIYSPRLQPSFNHPNVPLKEIPVTNNVKGMWGEVTVPWVDLIIANPPIRTPSFKDKSLPRMYYSQVGWIDDMKTGSDGKIYYRLNQIAGSYGDMFWAVAEGFKPITAEDIAPISPTVENKKVVVDVTRQTLSCFEDNREVHFCRVSTGAKFDYLGNAVDKWSTPLGPHPIYRKLVALHMSGQTTGDWPNVPWTSIITGDGVSVHSTYWHNDFGVPRSHGCVNTAPDDARFVFRWSNPVVPLVPGDLDVSKNWPPTGTIVEVVET
jgi:lipoprotein-anchoring transpeptidase ErfK/SrfK